jgi:hypothetical protein
MNTNRFEQIEHEERRYNDRLMVFAALRSRRGPVRRRRLLSALLWALGIR